ncbi:hypothetical protein GTO27_11575 [Candidatus Bathyarchaeota archaeon]|nr:hypothetical protein [Candidatus Bathyarchaeota archaeon]
MRDYSITTFLERLAEDDMEKEIIRLMSRGLTNGELLEEILKLLRGKKDNSL